MSMMQAQSLRDTLLAMPLPRLQEYVRLHKDDPYVVTMALSIANDKKKAATAQQGMAGRQPQPTVVDQQIAQMGPSAAPMPEDVGIGQLPAQNMQGMAGGGIVAFDGGGEVPRFAGGDAIGNQQFARWLESIGKTARDFIQATPTEQARLQAQFMSGIQGPAAPASATGLAAETGAAAAETGAAAANAGRLYNVGKALGKVGRFSAPAIAGTEILSNLAGHKFQEPGLDTSAGGVYDALKKGDYKQAGRNLLMGLPEAGMDVGRGIAGIGDYLLPGQPLTAGFDRLTKEYFGDSLRTPTDKTVVANRLSDYSNEGRPGMGAPSIGSTDAPLQTGEKLQKTEADNLTELKKQYNALTGGKGAGASMPSTAGLPGLNQMSSDEAKEAATKLVGDVNELPAMKMFQEQKNTFLERQKQREEAFLNEQALLPKFGVEAEQQLKAREKELAEDKKAAGWMSLIEAGLATMAGTSQFAFTNIGAGAQKGLASYRDSVKDFKKLQAEYDKMRVDIERGKVEEARGNFKARQEFFDRADTARDNFMKKGIDIVQSHTGLGIQAATQVFNTGIQQYGETARTVFREKGATDRSRAENESRVALGLLQLEQQQLPPELRGAMLLGTGDTKAERLQTGIPSLMALKDRMTETKLAELYQKHVTDSRKNLTEPMSPKDFAKSVRASINSFYPQVGDVSTDNLLKR
jgi:hypothetical protein